MSAASFAWRFALAFALLTLGVEVLRQSPLEPALLQYGFLQPAAALLNLLMPLTADPAVVAMDRALISASARLNVVRGCEGIETICLSIAALLAFPANPRSRALGLVLGIGLAWMLCVIRLSALHATLGNAVIWWPAIHGVIAPLLPVACVGVFIAWWMPRAR